MHNAMHNAMHPGLQMPPQQQQQQQQPPAPFCGVPGSELAAMAQAAWGQMDSMQGMQPPPVGMPEAPRHPGIPEQPQVSLSAQAELELELSLRGSLLVQQQRRIVQLEDELQRAWTEIDRLRTKIASVERERQRTDDDTAKQVVHPPSPPPPRGTSLAPYPPTPRWAHPCIHH